MIIKSIEIKEGLSKREIKFSSLVNLIYSEHNSKGKTTLLRFLLYAFGYSIPNTRNIKFEKCEVKMNILCDHLGEIELSRYNDDYIIVAINGVSSTYVLPDQLNELHSKLFRSNNPDILNNLLGVYYIDQEKGWTLLNRGTIIGSNHFNIEELVRGLSDCDCSKLINEKNRMINELKKYRQLFSIAKYKETAAQESESFIIDSYDKDTNVELDKLKLQQKRLKSELKRIDRTLSDNKRFRHFIDEMNIMISLPDGTPVQVTKDNIIGLNDIIDFLVTKRKMVASDLSSISDSILAIEKERFNEEQQLSFFESDNLLKVFDKKVASLPIDIKAIKAEMDRLEKSIKNISNEVSRLTKDNNIIASSLFANMLKYASELGICEEDGISPSYLFTSNLKELTGAILHKTVFAFRLSYIIEVEKKLGIKLPIILDSPSGKEVDPENIKLMMNILKRDFTQNQIIIASIYQYNFDNTNVIEIKNRLIE